jgi:hypothetical protein
MTASQQQKRRITTVQGKISAFLPVFQIRIQRIHKFLGLLVPDLLISGIDLDPHQNVMDPEHWFLQQNKIFNKSYSVADQDPDPHSNYRSGSMRAKMTH